MEWRRHVSCLHSAEGIPFKRKSVWIDIGCAKAGSRREHDDAGLFVAANLGGFRDTPVVAIISHDKRNGPSGFLFESAGIVSVKFPTGKRSRKIGRAVKHPISLVGSTPRTWSQTSALSARNFSTPAIQPSMTAVVPSSALVELWARLRETGFPSA